MDSKLRKEEVNTYKPMIGLIGIVVILWGVNLIFGLNGNYSDDSRGTFGDMFGAVNALFSGLAFAGLIFTISLQRKDLKIQYETLESQLKEMEVQSAAAQKSAEQFERQQQLTSYQLVQSTVNNLITIKNDFVEKYRFTPPEGENATKVKGIEGIEFVLNISGDDDNKKNEIFSKNQLIKRYLATIIYILQHISDSGISDEQKKNLADTLNLQTLDTEILLIYASFINGEQERALLERFGFYERYLGIVNG